MSKSITVITCQADPDYVRALVLRIGIIKLPRVKVSIIKNRHLGMLRYPEIAYKILKNRLVENPDVYVLTFRGYEILPWLLIVATGKCVIFDEFINAFEWVAYEHKILSPKSTFGRLFNTVYGFLLRRCDAILTDTDAHATISSELSEVPRNRYLSVPVSADETIFFPARRIFASGDFNVFFYGNVLPLHGINIMINAALQLKNESGIKFIFVGGKLEHQEAIEHAIVDGARILYKRYVPLAQLPDCVHGASLCLGGPFGDTFQSQYVVTGKSYQFLAAGIPTVIGASKASALFRDKENSLVVPQGDPCALAAAILWAYQHPESLVAIGKAGRKLYEDAFSNQIVTDCLATLLCPVVETFGLRE
jgi:glycosyltransferase involved in cell wall biosynthesis